MRIYKNTLPVLTNLIEHVVSKSLPQINEVIHRSVDLRQAFLERLSRDGLIYIVTLSQTTGFFEPREARAMRMFTLLCLARLDCGFLN